MNLEEEKMVTFKLFVFKNQNATEIRKFHLQSTEITFEKIEETLLNIFPNLKELKYKLLWKDEDDFITFSTAKEFSVFGNLITKSEANKEMKFFINFEDELFAVSKIFGQSRMVNNFLCNTCKKNQAVMCVNCTMRKSQQEQKIFNFSKQVPVQSTISDENCEPKASTSSDGFNVMNSASKPLSGKILCNTPVLKSKPFSPSVPATFAPDITAEPFGSPDFIWLREKRKNDQI